MSQFVITPAEMYEAERAVFATGRSSFALMRRAGQGVADLVQKHYPEGSIRVLCGPGGNGGDGFIAANRLASFGRAVSVYMAAPPQTLRGDCRKAFETWNGPVAPLSAAANSHENITLDALFGAGLSRPLGGVSADLAKAAKAPIISVDVPSGLDGTTGEALGACFQASLTVTFAALRPAHVLTPGRQLCGQVEVLDIGVPVTQHTAYRVQGGVEDDIVLSFRSIEGIDGLIGDPSDPPENRIEAVRLAAVQSGRAIVVETPDRILARPSGEVIVSA